VTQLTTVESRSRTFRARLPLFAIPVLALAALVTWGFSSPIGASPDDDFHLASEWCGNGLDAECTAADDDAERRLSDDLVGASACFAFYPDESGACQTKRFGDDFGDDLTTGLSPTPRGNFENLYPPVYYFVMSAFAGDNLEISAMTMRIVNSVLFVGVIAALFWLLPPPRRPTLLIALVVCMVPLGMFLVPSNNPSGWAILSAATFWIALLGFFESSGKRRIALGAVAAVTAVIGAGARADSALYVLLAIAVVFVMKFRWNRRFLLLSLVPIAIAAIAILLFLSAQQVTAASGGLEPNLERPDYSRYTLIVQNLLEMPGLWTGVFGTWNLGWLDTPLPAIVSVATIGVFCATVIQGLGGDRSFSNVRKNLAALLVLAMLWAIPLVILYRSAAIVGQSVQPRYVMPVIILLAGVTLLRHANDPVRATRSQVIVLAAALTVANGVALHTNIRRYVTGLDGAWGNLDKGVEWWWDIPVSPMSMWALGTVTFGAALFWLAALWLKQMRQMDDLDGVGLASARPLAHRPLRRRLG
jgi:hypothetical protein